MNQKFSCLNKWCQIIILFTIILLNVSACCASSNNNCTEYVRSFEKVLSRKRRYLAFLKGSNVIATMSNVKAIVIKSPKGYNSINEIDFFYPLPETWTMHKKKPLAPPAIVTVTVAPEPPHEEFDPNAIYWSHQHHSDHDSDFADHHLDQHDSVWTPESGWKNDISDTLNGLDTKERQSMLMRNDGPIGQPPVSYKKPWYKPTSSPKWSYKQQFYSEPNIDYRKSWYSSTMAPQVSYRINWYSTEKSPQMSYKNQFYAKPAINYKQSWYSTSSPNKYYSASPKQYKTNSKYYPRGRSMRSAEPSKEFDIEEHQDWEYYRAHKDRRDLFNYVEGAFESIPIKENMKDDYSSAMRSKKEDCWNIYEEKCPISIIDFLVNSQKIM